MAQSEISSEFEYSASFLRILIPGTIVVSLASFLLIYIYPQYISIFKEMITESVWIILPIGSIFLIVSIIIGLMISVLNIPLTMALEGYYLEKYNKIYPIGYLRDMLQKCQWNKFVKYWDILKSAEGGSVEGALAYDNLYNYFSHCLSDPRINDEFLFSWDGIPGNDNERLIEFLKKNFGIAWVETSKIEKIENDKTIKVSTETNYLSLKLNDEQDEVNLEIDDVRIDKFVVKIENSKLNIFNDKLNDELKKCIMPTKLGNVFKSMETYSEWKYGMVGVFFWTRIYLLMSEENKKTIDKIRAFVDMYVELTWIFFFAAIVYLIVLTYNEKYIFLSLSLFILILFSLVSYYLAVESALDYGFYVRSIFDLYRDELWNKIKNKQFNKLNSLPEKERWDSVFLHLWYYNTIQCRKCGKFYELTIEHVCDR